MAHKHDGLFGNQAFISDLDNLNLSNQQVAHRWGTGKTFIQKHRKLRAAGESIVTPGGFRKPAETTEQSSDGSRSVEAVRDRPVTLDDARAWIKSSGDNPDDFSISIRSIAYGVDMFSNRMSATPKTGTRVAAPDLDELLANIETYKPERTDWSKSTSGAFIICPSDLQAGKGDYGLDHHDLTERVMQSWAKAEAFCREYQPSEILIAELGDSVENINSTSSQRGTNTLALTEQIRLARRLLLEGIKTLAPLSPKLTYAAVPSNHGSVRIGPKSPENHVLDDYGIEIAEQLRDVVKHSTALSNVDVIVPELPHESLCLRVAGTAIGMSHGHLANSADGLSKFWQGQSHGRLPLSEADIALFGHFHSLRVQQSGDARWLMVSPASDNGSSWFTNKTGESSRSGMLTFTAQDGAWENLRIM
jgi:hypothetical protein